MVQVPIEVLSIAYRQEIDIRNPPNTVIAFLYGTLAASASFTIRAASSGSM